MASDPAAPDTTSSHTKALSRLTFAGVAAVVILLGTVGVWSMTVPISGAVMATGRLVTSDNSREVQSPTSGVVGTLNVREGAVVRQGDVVLEFDSTEAKSLLNVTEKKLDELRARSARLLAEQNGADAPFFPVALTDRADVPHVAETLETERALFTARRQAVAQRKRQLQEQIGQLEQEIAGRVGLQAAKRRSAEIAQQELKELEALTAVRIVRLDHLNIIQRNAARLDAEIAENTTAIARAKRRISEIKVRVFSLEDEMRAEKIQELRDTQAEISRLEDQRIASEMELKRVQIRAPIGGQVQRLRVNAGGVIQRAEPLMDIVPLNADLEVVARVARRDIDHVHVGQIAEIRLRALDQTTLPKLTGTVTRIPSQTVEDGHPATASYEVRLRLTEESRAALKDVRLIAGMQAEVIATTAPRTFASYIAKPILAQMERAFRED